MLKSMVQSSKSDCSRNVYEEVRARLQDPKAKVGQFIGTEVELAKSFGVARGTVRRALQHLVEEGLIERRVGQGLYVAERTVKLIEMLVPGIAEHWYAPAMRSAQTYAQARGVDFLIRDGRVDLHYEIDVVEQLPKSMADAAIIVSVGHQSFSEALIKLKLLGYPFVVLDEKATYADINWITVNYYQCGYLAATELLKLGHQRIACIGVKELVSEGDKMRGVMDAVLDAGLHYDRTLCVDIASPSHSYLDNAKIFYKEFRKAFMELMKRADRPTALVLPRERVAPVFFRDLAEMGLRVPDDISVVGYGHDKDDYTCQPRVSTIVPRAEEMGEKAVELLLHQAQSGEGSEKCGIEVDADWCPGESTGPVPQV